MELKLLTVDGNAYEHSKYLSHVTVKQLVKQPPTHHTLTIPPTAHRWTADRRHPKKNTPNLSGLGEAADCGVNSARPRQFSLPATLRQGHSRTQNPAGLPKQQLSRAHAPRAVAQISFWESGCELESKSNSICLHPFMHFFVLFSCPT